ncbi:unnamed protein product [Somion occarium]|uniref:Uncharacterized protein n=1 Tax=Somion occarium TaxID=3059160 RepID=A0ABP1D1Y1_9APHY
MSTSPHLPPPVINEVGIPPPSLNGIQHHESPSQLALMLTNSLRENEDLKRELALYKRKAEKADRLMRDLHALNTATGKSSNAGPSSVPPGHFDENAVKLLILECQERAERAEVKRDELEARIYKLQEHWMDFDRIAAGYETKQAEIRLKFSTLMASKGGELYVVGPGPPYATALAQARQDMAAQHPPQPTPNSRVRPRAGSLDGSSYPPHLAGGPPPAKRLRGERTLPDHAIAGRPRERHRSQSPQRMPPYNGLGFHNSLPHPGAFQGHPSHDAISRGRSRILDHEMDDRTSLHPSDTRGSHHRSGHRRRTSHSRSRSRASSASLDEMLLEATTGDDLDRPEDPELGGMSQGRVVTQTIQLSRQSSHHLSSHNQPARGLRHRSSSLDRDREYHMSHSSSQHASRSRGSTVATPHQSLHPSSSMSGPGMAGMDMPSGPGVPGMSDPVMMRQPGQVQYQTHTFAPPVTGPPVKKPKNANTPSSSNIGGLTSQGSVTTLGPQPTVSSIGGGGFPGSNAQGQRTCRQCGQPGRYKDGKCVEKWGPGPEGPGTVCDRCRKKMKRVERRGTLDSQQLASSQNVPHITSTSLVHSATSMNLMSGNGRGPLMAQSQTNRSIHRTDTLLVDQGVPSAPSHSSYLTTVSQRRDDSRTGAGSPRGSHSGGRSAMRSPPTPPSITTLPPSSRSNDVDEVLYDQLADNSGRSPSERDGANGRRSRQSTSSLSPPTPSAGVAVPSSRASPRVSESPRTTNGNNASGSNGSGSTTKGKVTPSDIDPDADADADADAEMDTEADADADAELLEAIDEAERKAGNSSTAEDEWLKKEEISI